MDLGIKTETFDSDDRSWLGSAHGAELGVPITLDGSAFTGTWADGVIPSGVALGIITATGLAAPYDAGAVDGTEVYVGTLLTTQTVIDKLGATVDVGAAYMWHGRIIVANLPANHGHDAAGAAQLPTMSFVGTLA